MAYERTSEDEMVERTAKVKTMLDAGCKNKEILDELGITYNQLITSLRKLGIYKDRVAEHVDIGGYEVETIESYFQAKLIIGNPSCKTEKFTDKDGKIYTDVSSFYGL